MDTNLPAVCQNNILLLSGCVSRAARELLQSQISLSNPSRADQAPKSFTFDAVYDETTQQKAFYEESCYDLVEGVMEGYNGTIFAYGQVSPCLFFCRWYIFGLQYWAMFCGATPCWPCKIFLSPFVCGEKAAQRPRLRMYVYVARNHKYDTSTR